MSVLPRVDLAKATRLTREGRLTEALAVLKGTASDHTVPSAERSPLAGFVETLLDKVSTSAPAWPGPAASTDHGPTPPFPLRLRQAFQGLADRIGKLRPAEIGDLPGAATGRVPASAPGGARFEERVYAEATGSRAYKLYIPSSFNGEPLPLLVMLHGCTQSPDDFALGTRMNEIAEEEGFFVAYPAQPQSANASKCWNWFREGDQRRDGGEPALLAGITRQIMRDVAVDRGRVYVAGLSAGGAAAAIMGQTYPDLYAAVGVHSGLACGAASDMASAFAAMRQGAPASVATRWPTSSGASVPTIVLHGDRDTTVSPVNGDQVIAQSNGGPALAIEVEKGEANGRAYTRTIRVDKGGKPVLEQWQLHGAGHAWSGGSTAGSYTDASGPDASRAMMRFFRHHTVRDGASR